jgi:hypothetical protein
MYQKQKGLATESESPAETYIIEIKTVSLYCRSQGGKKRGPQNEGKSLDLIEKKCRKDARFLAYHDIIEKTRVIAFSPRC